MKIERIRKNHKKKIIIGVVIVLALVSTITLTMSKSKYRLTQSMKLVTGTINYKVPDLRVVAVNISEDGTNYEIINDIPERGYILNEEKSICKVATETSEIENAPKDNNISIKYENNKISFYGITKRNTRCYLYFDKKVTAGETIIAGINKDYIKEGEPDFTQVATGAETEDNNGIYKTSDSMYNGETYYWRGAATTNHVIFADKCWRIVRINGDGSIRIILNGIVKSGTCTGSALYKESIISISGYSEKYNNSSYVGWTYKLGYQRPSSIGAETIAEKDSNAKIQTEDWFDKNITGVNLEKVDLQGKYCNDRNLQNDEIWNATGTHYYAPYKRSNTDYKPTLECDSKDIYELKAGSITIDEVMYAGGKYNTKNLLFYLHNDENYWTMSPHSNSKGDANMFYLHYDGKIDFWYASNTTPAIRPIINLKSNVKFTGSGTISSPLVVQ